MLQIVIANKNYSSWSLRGWLVLRAANVPFQEIQLSLNSPTLRADIAPYSPAGRVPVLIDTDQRGLAIWDSLAIGEYLAERYPAAQLWPADVAARARARSVCAEMHAGFTALRSAMPMNIGARLPGMGWNTKVQRDIDRIAAIWTELISAHGGPLLFGHFTIADAFFAPIATRFVTHGVALPPLAAAYRDAVLALPAMREWIAAAEAESEFVADDEPYRSAPAK